MARSSAWAVGSLVASRWLAATARISSPLATTAPTGTSPLLAALSAASRARRISRRSGGSRGCERFSCTETMIAVRAPPLLRGSEVQHHGAGADGAGRRELDGAWDGAEPEAGKEEVRRLRQQVRLFDAESPREFQGGFGQAASESGAAEVPPHRHRPQQRRGPVELEGCAPYDPSLAAGYDGGGEVVLEPVGG